MSIRLQSLVWGHPALSASERLVLLRLCDHADDCGNRVHPSVGSVAFATGLGERTVQAALRRLEAEGFLQVVANDGGGRPGSTRRYRVIVGRLKDRGTGAAIAPVSARDTGATAAGTGAPRSGTGARGAPESSVNHQRNINPPTTLRVVAPQGAKPQGRTRIPDDFALTDERLQAALRLMDKRQDDLTEILVRLKFDQFLDHFRALPGPKGMQSDWNAAWLRWVAHRDGKPQRPLRELLDIAKGKRAPDAEVGQPDRASSATEAQPDEAPPF